MHITVTGPVGGRAAAPIAARIPLHRIDDAGLMGLVDEDTGRLVPVQVDSRGRLCWLEGRLEAGEVRRYRLASEGFLAEVARVVVRELEGGTAEIVENGAPITGYCGLSDVLRPFLGPIRSPAGHVVTVDRSAGRVGPDNPAACPCSCWCGWGDVNGVDHWADGAGASRQRHHRFTLTVSGPVFGRVSALIDWLDPQGRRQLVEQRVFTVYSRSEGRRIIDVVSRLLMSDGPVTFGDTADGGTCAVCVAPALAPAGGGMLRNAGGEQGEEDCRGSAARWCDFTGQIGESFVGVSMFDFPGNPKYPTLWNVRDDGLMAANPFGLSGFLADPEISGARTFEAGTTVMFRYRLVVHDGALTPEEIDRMADCFAKSLEIGVD